MSRKSRYNQELLLQKVIRWKAGCYVRLSKEDKEHMDSSQSVLSQKQMIEKFLQAHPDIELFDYFVDDGYSGTDMERPEFQRMKQAFEDGVINCIIIKDLSRLARNDEESGKYIFIIFPFYNIRFISVNDHVDSYERPESVNNLEISFKNIMHSEYSRDLSKKVISASNVRRKRGEFLGAFCSYGYKKDPLDFHHLIIDEEPAEIVKYIFKRYLESQNIYAISQELSENGVMTPLEYKKSKGENLFIPGKKINVSFWKDSTVKRILTNEVYTGCLVQGKRRKISYKSKKIMTMPKEERTIVKGMHTPLVDEETFNIVQDMIKSRTSTRVKSYDWLLKGLLTCKECGKKLSIVPQKHPNKTTFYVRCNTYACNTHLHLCTPHSNNLEKLTNYVLEQIKARCNEFLDENKYMQVANSSKDKILKDRFNFQNEIKVLEKKLKDIGKTIDKLYEDKCKGLFEDEDFSRIYSKQTELRKETTERIKCLE